ncbi:MAG: LysR family transcriptional regulator [Deltaproteobacteria bacterium]|nr:LysR family transcriptional regulator [Deltaproteobacteria bacterium]
MSDSHSGSSAVASAEALHGIDLNLVVAFDALARERSVTRAAHRAGVTQSAMSHTLRKLRELLGDPLLVRGKGGMVLTPRAEALIVPLRSGLVTLSRALLSSQDFEPATVRRGFRIVSPDLFDVLALPGLLERLRRRAPGVDLTMRVLPASHVLHDQLETGDVDIAIVGVPRGAAAEPPSSGAGGIRQRVLLTDGLSCFLRADHPALGKRREDNKTGPKAKPLSLASYLGLSHALVSPMGEGQGMVDRILANEGLQRRIALRVPHFYSAPAIIARSDLVLTAPTALRSLLPPGTPLVVLPPPLPLPEHAIVMIWHERFSEDPGHRWLRGEIAEVSAEAAAAV